MDLDTRGGTELRATAQRWARDLGMRFLLVALAATQNPLCFDEVYTYERCCLPPGRRDLNVMDFIWKGDLYKGVRLYMHASRTLGRQAAQAALHLSTAAKAT